MAVKKHARRIIDELRTDDKERVVFYLDAGLQIRLKKVCSDQRIRMSSVIEKLVENFLQDLGEIDADEADTKTQGRDKKK